MGDVTAAGERAAIERLYYANLSAVVVTDHETVEEGQIHEFDADGFRIGARGHWVRWSQVRRAGEIRRG